MVLTTTFRTEVIDGIVAMLESVKAANPTLLRRVYRARPANPTVDLPCAFIESRSESIRHTPAVRNRTMTVSVIVLREYSDNIEDMTAMDTLADILMEAFTASPQFAANTIWEDMTLADEEYVIGDYLYPATRWTVTDITDMKGRI